VHFGFGIACSLIKIRHLDFERNKAMPFPFSREPDEISGLGHVVHNAAHPKREDVSVLEQVLA